MQILEFKFRESAAKTIRKLAAQLICETWRSAIAKFILQFSQTSLKKAIFMWDFPDCSRTKAEIFIYSF